MIKGTVEEMRAIAKKKGGKCLSRTYTHHDVKLEWQCKNGHRWHAKPSSLRQGYWCLQCYRARRATIQQIQAIAKSRGGECISDAYVNKQTKVKWRCGEGHVWMALLNSVKQGSWCPRCYMKVKGTIRQMRSLAEARGGRCLSPAYFNCRTKLEWQCGKGHKWAATPDSIKQGSWCPECYRIRHSRKRRGVPA